MMTMCVLETIEAEYIWSELTQNNQITENFE